MVARRPSGAVTTAVLLSDLEKSVEELQRNSSVNHGLVTEQDVEQKSKELRTLGETLTELKSELMNVHLIKQAQICTNS